MLLCVSIVVLLVTGKSLEGDVEEDGGYDERGKGGGGVLVILYTPWALTNSPKSDDCISYSEKTANEETATNKTFFIFHRKYESIHKYNCARIVYRRSSRPFLNVVLETKCFRNVSM